MRPSLAYRNNTWAIWNGKPPEKYTRLLPHITGSRILEIGSAEGVLALLLAERGAMVTALELREDRYEEAVRLKQRWKELGKAVQDVALLVGDIRWRTGLFQGHDTLVAVRSIYYLREDAPRVMKEAASYGIKNVVLCGNKNRAARWNEGDIGSDGLGPWNVWASIQGMYELLEGAGYEITNVVDTGDPIVTGRLVQG